MGLTGGLAVESNPLHNKKTQNKISADAILTEWAIQLSIYMYIEYKSQYALINPTIRDHYTSYFAKSSFT